MASEQPAARPLHHFHGGVHLPGHKHESTRLPIRPARLPKILVIPLAQHIGQPAEPLVAVGETVLKGQLIARAADYVSAPVHASSSGTVVAIEDRPIPHPSGRSAPCIVIETDGQEQWRWRKELPEDYRDMDPSHLRNLIREAGIVGLGGAGFPTAVKLNPLPGKLVKTLILNGAECEPYITCDDMLMRERPYDILSGLEVMRHALQAETCVIAVENNKPQAIEALRQAIRARSLTEVEVVEVPTVYPAGAEKQLIKTVTGEEVPSNGLPIDIGVVCHNVGTASAVHRAVTLGEPLISRIVTIAGGVAEPRNLEVLIGTPFHDLLEECHGVPGTLDKLIMGGPMMGVAVHTDAVPVIKTTNCILAVTRADMPLPHRGEARPCIRCGRCYDVCPMELLPQQLYWYARAKDLDKVQEYHLFDCIECGCCDYVCPSHIPLVQYYRYAKTAIWAREREREKADLARRRFEARQARLEREKRERAERHKKRRVASEGERQAKILDALEKAKTKKRTPGADDGEGDGA